MNQIAVGKYFRLILLSILFLYRTANAQQAVSSEEDLKKQADKAFSSEKYDEALSPYSQLLSLYPSNATYNYRYGVALLQAGKNKANAVSYLEIAAKDVVNPQEVWIYLGQSYMIIGKFEDALGCFQKFESIVNAAMLKKFNSDELKANCRNAIELLKSRKNVAIISTKDVARNEFYKFFDWSNANGKIVPAAEQFLTSKDKDNQLNPVMFIANDRQTIYLSSFGKKGDKGKDIYIIRKMPNGDWSQPENLGEPINTEANEDFPYLDRDGRTLYFSSKSKASIGGYDIFKSKYDFNTGKWSTPENLGWPINTISDDYLYVPDQKGLEANYATAVSSLKNEIEIRRIQIPDAGQSLVTISGYYAPLDQKVRRDARITILRSSGEGIITSVYTDPTTGKYEVTLEPGQDYVIVVEGGGYLPHAENFNLPSNVANSELKQIVKLNRDRSNESLTLENYFYPASAVRDVPSEVKTASFDAEIDSTSLMAVQINNQTVMVTKPGTGKQDVETATVSKANQVNIEKKDGYDPTLEKTSADEVRQKIEEEGRAKEVADEGKKSSEYDVTIGNEELASIAIIDAKTAREEADSLNREVVRLNAGAIERDSLSAQYSAKAEVATEQDKPTYLNEAYVLKAEADNMRRQAADLQVAAMAKDTEAKASEQEANELLATINSGKGKNTAKAKEENKDKTQPSLAKTDPALFEKSKSEDKTDVNEIKELSPAQTPVVKDESPASGNVSESTVAINTPVESVKSGVNSTEKNDNSSIEKSKPAEKSPETNTQTETTQKVSEPSVATTEKSGSPTSGKATSETVPSDKIQENTNTASEITGVKSSGEVQENKSLANESAGVKTSGDTHDEIVGTGAKSDTPNAGVENSGAQPTTKNTTGNLKTESNSEPAVAMTPNSGAGNSKEKKSESDVDSKITDTKSEVVENVANSPADKSTQTVTGEKQIDSVPTTPVVENKKSADVDGKSSAADGNKASADQQPIADNNKIESKSEDQNTVNKGQDGTNKAQENSEPIVSHEKSSTESTPLAVTENKIQNESEKLNPGATEKNDNTKVDTKVAGVTSEVVTQNDKKEIANSITVDSKKDEAPVANVEHDETISSKNNEPIISEQKLEQTTDVAEKAATEKDNTTANKIEDSVAENKFTESLSETSSEAISEANSTSEKIKTNDGQVSSDQSIAERTNAPADQNVPSSDNSVANKVEPPAGNTAQETPSTVISQNELADNLKESGQKDPNLNAGDTGNSVSTADSVKSDTHISQVELKPPFVVPAEEKKAMPDNINTLKLYPVSEEARIAYQAFKSKYKNSKQLSDQSIELQNRISKTKPSAERDSMIMVSNILSEQSSEQYLEAVNQLKAAETIDPDVKHKMEMNEQIVAYNSSMPAGSKGKDSPQLNDPNDTANTIETNTAVTDDQQIARVGDEKAGDIVESLVSENNENRSVENNETPVAEAPAENVSNEASTELTAEEAKALDEATTFTVETPNGKEVVKIDTTGIDTRHPEFQNYVEINKAITGKQVETIDVFAAAVNQNKIAVEQKQEQNRLMDKAEVEQDRPTKAQLFIQADAMRDSSKKNEAEAAEKFALAQQKTNEVKSKTAEMQEIRKRIAIPGRDLPAQATKSTVKPLGLSDEEVLAMTKSQSATESASTGITPTSANVTSVPATSFAAEKVEQFAQKSFSISNSPVYSKANPIPMNPPIPDGLVFKVQIGAFRNEIAAEKFQGVQPITAETTRPGWIRYCVGLFQTFEPAVVVKKEMQQRGFKDAFVVAYLNGKRIGLDEAYAMIGKGKSTPDQTYIQQSQTEMALLRANNIRPENIASIRKNLIDDDEKSFYGENASAVKKSLAAVEYAVQVGVYKTSLVPKGLQSLMPLFTEKINASLYRFTSDHYSNYASADSMKRIARREGVKDAFIVVYRNGVQSSLASVPLAERTVKPVAEVATAGTTSSDSKSETVGTNLSVTSQPAVERNSSNEKIIYRVQLGAFKNNIPFSSVVTFLNVADKGITQVTDERGLHIFYAGTCDDFSTASTLREEIVGKGVTDAFVVAIRDGKRIVITDDMKLKK